MAGWGKSTNSANDYMFLGDSITAREDWNVLLGVTYVMNAGVSGNTTDDVLARLDPLLTTKPKKIFLMIGINDLLKGKDVPYILANYETILDRIRSASPDTVIYIESVLPINNDISQLGIVDDQKITALNGELKSLADGKSEIFIDLYPSFCGSDHKLYTKYTNDGVHLNANGYAVWENLIVPYVK